MDRRPGDPPGHRRQPGRRPTDRWCRSHHRSGRRPTRQPSTTGGGARPTCARRSSRSRSRSRSGRRRVDDTAQQILKATALIARDKGLVKAADKELAAGHGPGHVHRQRGRGVLPPSSRRSAATSPSGSPTCVTSARARSRRCSASRPRACPTSPSRASSSPRTSRPAETATLDRALVVGIVTEAGGRTSHTAILAAQMGIPAVVQLAGATGIPAGTPVALDGDTGEVTIAPDIDARRGPAGAARDAGRGPGAPVAGRVVTPRRPPPSPCSPTSVASQDAVAAGALDLEGVGLFRTEFVLPLGRRRPRRSRSRRRSTASVFAPFEGSARRRAHARCRRRQAADVRRPRARRRTPPSGVAGCGSRPSGPSCSTPSSRRSPSPPARPAPTCGSWRRWSRRPRRPRGSPGGSARTACPRPG